MDDIPVLKNAGKVETALALLRAELSGHAKRMDEIATRSAYTADRFDRLYAGIEDRLRLSENTALMEKARVDAALRLLDDIKATLPQQQQALKLVRDEVLIALDRSVLDVRADLNESIKEREKLEDRIIKVESLIPSVRAIVWVGAAMGLSVIALVWSLIIGRAEIIFK